jgi:hypothetical protein
VSSFDCATEFAAVGLRGSIGFREIDQFMACEDCIQATQSHQGANGGLTFTESKQLGAEISKSALRLSYIPRGLIMLADLPRADRQLSRSRQLHVSERKHPLDRVVAKAQYRLHWSADQLERDLT